MSEFALVVPWTPCTACQLPSAAAAVKPDPPAYTIARLAKAPSCWVPFQRMLPSAPAVLLYTALLVDPVSAVNPVALVIVLAVPLNVITGRLPIPFSVNVGILARVA